MREKLKQNLIHLNLTKAVIIFIVTGLCLVFSSFVVVYNNFRDKNIEWENIKEADEEKETGYGKEDKPEKELHLTAANIALITWCAIIIIVLGVWYWLLCLVWAYQKSYRIGINSALCVLAALFFNIGAVLVLYIYAMAKGTCRNCGRLKTSYGKFCDRCGKPLKKECPQCGQVADVKVSYCINCGKKLYKGRKQDG